VFLYVADMSLNPLAVAEEIYEALFYADCFKRTKGGWSEKARATIEQALRQAAEKAGVDYHPVFLQLGAAPRMTVMFEPTNDSGIVLQAHRFDLKSNLEFTVQTSHLTIFAGGHSMSVDILDNVNDSKEFTIREMKNGRYRFLRRIEIQKAEVARQAKWHSRKTKSRTWMALKKDKIAYLEWLP